MRRVALACLLALALAGCGTSDRTVGQAAEEWCHRHYGMSDDAEYKCFTRIFEQRNPSKFLQRLEWNDEFNRELGELLQAQGGK